MDSQRWPKRHISQSLTGSNSQESMFRIYTQLGKMTGSRYFIAIPQLYT